MRRYQYKKPYRARKKRSIFKNRFFWLGILISVSTVAVFYFLFISSYFQIEKIIISGNQKVLKEDIQAIVEKELEQKIFFLSKKNIFLVSLNKIKKAILEDFPQIAKAEIRRGLFNVLDIYVTERFAKALWCQDYNPFTTSSDQAFFEKGARLVSGQCFLIDSQGVIFKKETEFEENLVKIIDKQNAGVVILGERVVEKDYLEKIFKIQKKLAEDHLKIIANEFIIFAERLNLKTFEGWEIYFDPKRDIGWQLTKLSLVLKEKIPLEKRKDLEYIDLRFGNFASYKYK